MKTILEYIKKTKSSDYIGGWIPSYDQLTVQNLTKWLNDSGYKGIYTDELHDLKLYNKSVKNVRYYQIMTNYKQSRFIIFTPVGRKYQFDIYNDGSLYIYYFDKSNDKTPKGLDLNKENLNMINQQIFA